VENDEANRLKYRQLLLATEGLEQYISGVILTEVTQLALKCDDGTPVAALLQAKGILAGVRVDKGVEPLAGTKGECVTQGIDDLDVRCKQHYEQGFRFAKWRAVLHIKDSSGATPSDIAVLENANTLARFASICQQHGLVPVVEPEVLMDGDFTIEVAAACTERVLAACVKVRGLTSRSHFIFGLFQCLLTSRHLFSFHSPYHFAPHLDVPLTSFSIFSLALLSFLFTITSISPRFSFSYFPSSLLFSSLLLCFSPSSFVTPSPITKALSDHHVMFEGMLLKPNMVRSGSSCIVQAPAAVIGLATLRVIQHTVPCAVPGITFLSGGMSEEEASLALSCINTAAGPKPWVLTFSYGRALQDSCLKTWRGKDENVDAARQALLARALANSLASVGKYEGGIGGDAAKELPFAIVAKSTPTHPPIIRYNNLSAVRSSALI
jgi:fructose-bisphosphate aldolase class 1